MIKADTLNNTYFKLLFMPQINFSIYSSLISRLDLEATHRRTRTGKPLSRSCLVKVNDLGIELLQVRPGVKKQFNVKILQEGLQR
jgi:hypothetical protein